MSVSDESKAILDEILDKDDESTMAYLKQQINSSRITAEDVLDYTEYYSEEEEGKKIFVLNPEIIYRFGVFIGKKNPAIKVKFYQIAAERGSSDGNENYAKCLLREKKYAEALPFAKKAVELTATSATKKHKHKFTLWKLLIANKQYDNSSDVLIAYVESLSLPDAEKKYRQCINDLKIELDGFVINEENNIDVPEIQAIKQLISLTEKLAHLKKNHANFNALREELYFLKGQYAEKLSDAEEAWFSYCKVTDKTSSLGAATAAAKIKLLKDKVQSLLVPLPAVEQLGPNDEDADSEELEELSTPVKLMGACRHESTWFDSMNRATIEKKYQQRLAKIEKKRKEIEDEENSMLDSKIYSIEENINQSREEHLPENRKTHRRYLAERNFFNPQRSKKQQELMDLTYRIIEKRYQIQANSASAPLNLINKSSRLFITAERLYQEAVIALSGNYSPYLGIPRINEKPWSFGRGTTGYGPKERYQVGASVTESEHRTSPKRNRLGDSYLRQFGSYSNDIYPFLNKLCNQDLDKEKQLATWMIRYGKNHESVSIAELQTIYPKATQAHVNSFNHICFLIMEKEQMQWHSAVEPEYLLGMTVAQARALILIKEGYLSLKEVFKNEVFFGVYSQKELLDHPERVKDACEHIEEMYTAYLKTKYASQYLTFFKGTLKEGGTPECVLTREQAHQDLKAVYGGESDTENEGYESDLSFSG